MSFRLALFAGAICLLLTPFLPAGANGGTLQLSRAPAGPFGLTVYTSPTPLREGLADVSVAVEWAESGDLESDARVVVIAEPIGHSGAGGAYEATHERATDPGFYAADVLLPGAGRWRLEILAQTIRDEGAVVIEVDVLPAIVPSPPQPQVERPAALLALGIAALAAFIGGLAWRRRQRS
jgi:hypothetical protein